jgi:hydroxymethylbilane synthase
VGVQIREGDDHVARWVGALDHEETRVATTAERSFLRTVEGGCHVPVGALGQVEGELLRLRGVVCSLAGDAAVDGSLSGPCSEAQGLGAALAQELLGRGGEEILEGIRKVEQEG